MQIHLDNQGEEGSVTVTVQGPGAVRWAIAVAEGYGKPEGSAR